MIAAKLIKVAKTPGKYGVSQLLFAQGETKDIVNSVLHATKKPEHLLDTKDLAKELTGSTQEQTAYNIWKWVKRNVKYELDPPGFQFIKAPNKVLSDGFSDCKSRTIFIHSLLVNSGIKAGFRFVAFQRFSDVKHVYVIALINNRLFVLDPDMPSFNQEKEYIKKEDYMTQIYYVAGISEKEGILSLPIDSEGRISNSDGIVNDVDMEVAIRKQRDQINKNLLEGIAGVGCPHAEKVQDRIDAYNDVIEIRRDPKISGDEEYEEIAGVIEDYKYGIYNNHSEIAGIGDIGKKSKKREQKKAARKEKRAKRKAEGKTLKQRIKKTTKKVAEKVKKVAKGALRIATAPQRLAVKGILEVLLPKSATYFIYLFVTKPDLIAKMPALARSKRTNSEKVRKFIVNTIGMKESHFMGIIRNGIMKRYKKSPEVVLKNELGFAISGIGVVPVAAALPVVINIIKKLSKVFGKKKEAAELESDLLNTSDPDISTDFSESTKEEKEEFKQAITLQPQRDSEKSVLDDTEGAGLADRSLTNNTGSRNNKLC